MVSDSRLEAFDRTTLESVARLTVAELRPAASTDGRADRRADLGRTTTEAGPPDTALEIKSAAGFAQVSEGDLSRALAAALRTILGGEDVVLLRGAGIRTDAVVRRLVERLPSMVEARRRMLTEAHIEALVDAYLPADALASVMPDIEADNARAQADFLRIHPVLTAEEVADRAGHGATNRSATANRWKSEQRIFAVRARGREVYPAFQFKDGRPRPAVRSAIKALGARSGWQTAFWFITPNGWLGGPAPLEQLEDADALSAAAVHEADAWVG